MVRCRAPQGKLGGSGICQFDHSQVLSLLRRWPSMQERVSDKDKDQDMAMQEMREKVLSTDWDHIRLEEDSPVRMDRVPHPPVRIPFSEHVGI